MKRYILLFLTAASLFYTTPTLAQKVGLVLSGGGATGLAHIGVLKALEEAEIPIDYITGSSMGALIGALYACGYSPEEIKAYVLSDKFIKIISNKPSKEERFLLREKATDASILHFNFTLDSMFRKSLPTNFLNPSYLDFETLRLIGIIGAAKGSNFDSLYLPFRCVASDVYNEKSIVFREGSLNAAVRASMTFPFYLNPIRINGKLLFDGGLYNNFPADVLYHEFPVDYIIGSNVSSNNPPPQEGELISQITSLFTKKTDFSLPSSEGIIINPQLEAGTFDFDKVEKAIQEGYETAQKYIDTIRKTIHRHLSQKERNKRRAHFRASIPPLQITDIEVDSRNIEEVSFIENDFIKDTLADPLNFKKFKKRYFRSYAAPQIKYIFPTLQMISDSTYQLHLEVTKEKPFSIRVGGLLSSRPINMGYIGLSYLGLGKGALAFNTEIYFGKFYASTKIDLNYDIPTLFPMRVTPYFVLNRWDYYESSTTFFENVNPSFMIQNETYYGLKFAIPTQKNAKLTLDLRKFKTMDQYYKTLQFKQGDTANTTNFRGETIALEYEWNTLNRKQWASKGGLLKVGFRYVQGKEESVSGNTSEIQYNRRRWHQWIGLYAEGRKYFTMTPFLKLGLYGEVVLNSKSLFSTYTASVLATSTFTPLPDSRTLYMKEYRAPQFIGGGIDIIFNYREVLELRVSPYFFQPFRQIIQHDEGSFGYSNLLREGVPMAGASIIYHSPVGPLRLSTNYFPHQDRPFVTELSFGYVLFNDRAFR